MQVKLEEITFESIFPVWQKHLWKDRLSDIKPMSSMLYLGGYNMEIYKKFQPFFFFFFVNNELAGVNSCHQTDDKSMRSRGVFIFEKYRSLKLSRYLFDFVEDKAIKENCNNIWSLPRASAIKAYHSFGFNITSDLINENVEFGPNYYVLKSLLNKLS
jgi:GNAT superfamily N-acetyltransferase